MAYNITPKGSGFLRLKQVLARVPICRSTLYAKIRAGEFPSPMKFGRLSFWLKSDIDDFIDKICLTSKQG